MQPQLFAALLGIGTHGCRVMACTTGQIPLMLVLTEKEMMSKK
jgi:hypothetical protein